MVVRIPFSSTNSSFFGSSNGLDQIIGAMQKALIKPYQARRRRLPMTFLELCMVHELCEWKIRKKLAYDEAIVDGKFLETMNDICYLLMCG